MAVNVHESVAVLARLMIQYEIKCGSEAHEAYSRALDAIKAFGVELDKVVSHGR